LDSICSNSDLVEVSKQFFASCPTAVQKTSNPNDPFFPTTSFDSSFSIKLDVLLSWSTSHPHLGPARSYTVASLLSNYLTIPQSSSSHSIHTLSSEQLIDLLFNWVSTSPLAAKDLFARPIAEVLSELARIELISLGGWLMRLMVRGIGHVEERTEQGEKEEGETEEEEGGVSAQHLRVLREWPVFEETSSLGRQRRVALYGTEGANKRVKDDGLAEKGRKELEAGFPELSFQNGTLAALSSHGSEALS
jgi:hypothetical protein